MCMCVKCEYNDCAQCLTKWTEQDTIKGIKNKNKNTTFIVTTISLFRVTT